jgi:hypothetical protein
MALAALTLSDGSHRAIDGEKALHYWNLLHGRGEPTEEEASKIMYITDIKLPPSYQAQAQGYQSAYEPFQASQSVKVYASRLNDENTPQEPVLRPSDLPQGKDRAYHD